MTPDPQEAERHLLSEARNRQIFADEIAPDLLADITPVEQPTLVVLVAQQGAGKTRMADQIAQQLNTMGGFADIDSDLYKPYHPDYAALMAKDDQLMAAYTGRDGQRWMGQAQAYVREHRLNALLQETAQSPPFFEETLRTYREAGFRIELVALGVPEAMSRLGVVGRYYEQLRDTGAGRLSVPEKAAASYTGIMQSADLVDAGQLADEVAVFRRGEADPRYRNSLADGAWLSPPGLREAIETERARPWTIQESTDFVELRHKLVQVLGPEWHGELNAITDLARPLIAGPLTLGDSVKTTAESRPQHLTWDPMSDMELAALQECSQRAVTGAADHGNDLHQQHTALRTAYVEQAGGAVVAGLRAQRAPQEAIEPARSSALQDIVWVQHKTVETRIAGDAAAVQARAIGSELERRAGLSPQQRQAEAERRRQIAGGRATPPQSAAPQARPGPQPSQPPRGQSL